MNALKSIILLIMIVFSCMNAVSQEKITVRATGKYNSSELSQRQIRDRAIEEAKREALNKAGVAENVSFTDFSYIHQHNERFAEIFQSISSIETGGEIIVDSIISEKRSFNDFGNMEIEVEIQATIYQHRAAPDPTFRFRVAGIDRIYSEGQLLKFNFTPFADGYLKIFNITDTEAETSLLYPFTDPHNRHLNDDQSRMFVSRQSVVFPVNPHYSHGYTLELENQDIMEEFSILMFVFTKQNYPFIEKVNFANMMKWIYSIPPDQRTTEQYGFIIKKK